MAALLATFGLTPNNLGGKHSVLTDIRILTDIPPLA
jgi:hypothetical protein